MAQLYILIRAIFQILPITILPWGFYFIPFVLGKKFPIDQMEDIHFEESLLSKNLIKDKSFLSLDDKNSPSFRIKNEIMENKLLSLHDKTREDDEFEEKNMSLN